MLCPRKAESFNVESLKVSLIFDLDIFFNSEANCLIFGSVDGRLSEKPLKALYHSIIISIIVMMKYPRAITTTR